MRLNTYIQPFWEKYDNCEFVTYKFLKSYKISASISVLSKHLKDHPDYPSMLALSDILNDYGIKNISIKTSIEELTEIERPMIAQIQINDKDFFTVFRHVNDNIISYLEPNKSNDVEIDIKDFAKIFSGIILLADASEYEKAQFRFENKIELKNKLNKFLTLSLLPIFVVSICAARLINLGFAGIWQVSYTFATFIGFVVTLYLNWYEIDSQNPALQKICSFGRKTNCRAIINSKVSKVFGVSWSKIGFAYFFVGLCSLLVTGIKNQQTLALLSLLNLTSLPYIVFSIYYQGIVAKQWCPLCLASQGVLSLQFMISLFGGFLSFNSLDNISIIDVIPILVFIVLSYYIIVLLIPALFQFENYKSVTVDYKQLKFNETVFKSLLKEQKPMLLPCENIGLTIGADNAKYKIVMASNPYCDPCSRAHQIVNSIMAKNNDIQLRIIFPVGGVNNEERIKVIRHLLLMKKHGDPALTKRALENWYNASVKDYNSFVTDFPLNTEALKSNDLEIEYMSEWCDKMNINATPTFFINGFQLPKIYSATDLKYLLSF